MKRRSVVLTILFVFVLAALSVFTLTGCKKSAAGETMALVPVDAAGVININFKKLSQLEFFDKLIKDEEQKKTENPIELFKDYKDFVDKTGIDLKKDVRSVGIAMLGKFDPGSMDKIAVLLVSLNSKNDKLAAFFKTLGDKIVSETYNGETIYKIKEGENKEAVDTASKEVGIAVIGGTSIVMGSPDNVKKVIDVAGGKSKSIKDSPAMKPFLDKMNSDMIFSFAILVSEEAKKAGNMGPMKFDLSKAEALTGYADYSDKTWKGLIQLICKDEKVNKKLADTLNSLKGMGVMAGPEAVELINKITITGTSDSVKIDISIPDELFEKLKKKMDEKKTVEQMPTENAPTDATQPTEENKTGEDTQSTSNEGEPQ